MAWFATARDDAFRSRVILFAAALPLCWLMPRASVSLWAGVATLACLSAVAGEIALHLGTRRRVGVALTAVAAALGAGLGAWSGPAGLP